MTLKKLTHREFVAIQNVESAIKEMSYLGGTHSNIEDFFINYDVTESDFDGVLADIRYDELYKAIQRYNRGDTSVVGVDTAGAGFYLVEILHNDYDNVFGFTLDKEGKVYHYCKSHSTYNDELERDETYFYVDDDPLVLEDFSRNC